MDWGKLINAVLSNPELLGKVISALTGLISKPKPPSAPVTVPTPIPGREDGPFPDDMIPAPASTSERKIAKVVAKLARVQLSGQRFPNEPDNGLLHNLAEMQSGQDAIPWASKIWIDLTAYDEQGKEFLTDAVGAAGLAYETEHHVGDALVQGKGGTLGNPNPGYVMNGTDDVGVGSTAWISSNGFLCQFKAFNEGERECFGKVGGVESNHFTLRIS